MTSTERAPQGDELDASITVAERKVIETDRRLRASAAALGKAWRGRAGNLVRWSAGAAAVGIAALLVYRMVGARRRSAEAYAVLRGRPAPPMPLRGGHWVTAAAPARAATAELVRTSSLLSILLPLALRLWRALGRRPRSRPSGPIRQPLQGPR